MTGKTFLLSMLVLCLVYQAVGVNLNHEYSEVKKLPAYGSSTGGQPFEYRSSSSKNCRLSTLLIKQVQYINGLEAIFDCGGNNFEKSGQVGNWTKGNLKGWEDEGKQIVKVNIWTGALVDGFEFVFADGSTSFHFGGYGGSQKSFNVDAGWTIMGVYGRTGDDFDQLGFIVGR